jgi:deoxyribonuclease (pyrimidine dimer)
VKFLGSIPERVEDLADQHLFAEWRETKMIVPAAKRSLAARPIAAIRESILPQYTLNTGHVTFFYNKLPFLSDRFQELTEELHQRNFDIAPFKFETDDYKFVFDRIVQTIWHPTKHDIQVNIERIAQRLNEKPNWYRYYGDVYAPDFFIDRYNQQLLFDTIAVA